MCLRVSVWLAKEMSSGIHRSEGKLGVIVQLQGLCMKKMPLMSKQL